MNVAIVDYGAGNLRSVHHALWEAGADPVITGDPEALSRAERIVLPGVGAAGAAMERLRALGFDGALDQARRSGRPILGICLGLQLMAEEIEEYGIHRGLGWLKGRVAPISPQPGVSVPHIGWARIETTGSGNDFVETSVRGRYFYFCHSNRLYGGCDHAVATVAHGEKFPVAIRFENVFAVQFHPEKSQLAGQRLLKRFLGWNP